MNAPGENGSKKWRPLEKMFHEVPARYDLLNRIITMGLDRHWRKLAAGECLAGNPQDVLDLCTGTGDLVVRMAGMTNGHARFHALDYSEPMLVLAREKASRKGLNGISFIHGDAASMPFGDGSMDAIGIGFAFRNLTYKNPHRDRFLNEIHRVLKKNGRFVIIESSQPRNRFLRTLFRIYLEFMVGRVGGLLSGHRKAYRYLSVSARNFHTPEEIREMLMDRGFRKVEHRSLSGGIAGLTVAIK